MKSLNEYIKKDVKYYTFENYCEDHNILYENINDDTHKDFVMNNWSIVFHRPYYVYKSHVYESLLKSYDTKKLYDKIVDKFGKYIVKYYAPYKDKATTKSLIIVYKDNIDFTKDPKFISLLNLYNYFITYIDYDNKEIHLEPNIPDDETNYIYDKCNGMVFHITLKNIYETKIKKYGLKPKTASYRKYPERVFVTTGENKKDIEDNIEFVKQILKEDVIYTEDNIIVLKIDLNKYKNKITLYKDNGMMNKSFWTSEYIPPYCIEIFKENNYIKI